MLLELNVQGYRSLKNVPWKPGALNVVIGPNGSGKSNLLRIFELLSANASGRLKNFVQGDGGIRAIRNRRWPALICAKCWKIFWNWWRRERRLPECP